MGWVGVYPSWLQILCHLMTIWWSNCDDLFNMTKYQMKSSDRRWTAYMDDLHIVHLTAHIDDGLKMVVTHIVHLSWEKATTSESWKQHSADCSTLTYAHPLLSTHGQPFQRKTSHRKPEEKSRSEWGGRGCFEGHRFNLMPVAGTCSRRRGPVPWYTLCCHWPPLTWQNCWDLFQEVLNTAVVDLPLTWQNCALKEKTMQIQRMFCRTKI